jgi:hypothetical protein
MMLDLDPRITVSMGRARLANNPFFFFNFLPNYVTATVRALQPWQPFPMAKGTLEKIQNAIITTVNYSPVVLVILLVTWSYLAFNLSFCRTLIADGNVFQGKNELVLLQLASLFANPPKQRHCIPCHI